MWRFTKKSLALVLCICIMATNLFIATPVFAADGTVTVSGSYRMGECFDITVTDSDIASTGNISVQVVSSTTPAAISVVLSEEAEALGTFKGIVRISIEESNDGSTPPQIQAAVGDTITITYSDADPSQNVQSSFQVTEPASAPAAGAALAADPAPGAVASEVEVTLTCATTDAAIYYNINSIEEPSESSILYDDLARPKISGYTIIKAIAIKDGIPVSDTVTFAYNAIPVRVQEPGTDGTPAANVKVELYDWNGWSRTSEQTDAGGYAYLNPVGLGEGTYTIRAYPVDASNYSMSVQELSIQSGGYNGGTIVTTLTTQILSGNVVTPVTNLPVISGWIDVEECIDDNGKQYTQYMFGFPIRSDGTYGVPPLGDGSFRIRANPDQNDINYIGSQWQDITISGGVVTDPASSPVNLTVRAVQVTGSVKYPDGTTDVPGDKFNIQVGLANSSDGLEYICNNFDSAYKIGGLPDGSYILTAESKEATYTRSFESLFEITDGVTADSEINLELTTPQLTGTVSIPGVSEPADSSELVGNGHVDILDSMAESCICNVPVDDSGAFKIGGFKDGTYKLRAYPPDGSEFVYSDLADISITDGICSPLTINIPLKQKALTLKWVGEYEKGNNEVHARLVYTDLLEDSFSGLTAEISGGVLETPISLQFSRYDGPWEEDNQGEVFFRVDEDTQPVINALSYGDYTFTIKSGGNPVLSGSISIIQGLNINPYILPLADYKTGAELSINPRDINGAAQTPVWSITDTLAVKVTANGGEPVQEYYNESVTPDADKITVSIPSSAVSGASAGNRCVEVYKGGKLIARGGFDVGDSSINFVYANEASNEVFVNGEYLENYMKNGAAAELWSGENLIAASTETRYFGELSFRFPINFEAGSTYDLKIYNEGSAEAAAVKAFTVRPRLDIDNPVVITGAGASTLVISESSVAAFGWSASDELMLYINGPGLNYTATSANGVIVADSNITLAIDANTVSGMQPGDYFININRGGTRIGFAEFIAETADDNVIKGTVTGPGGAPSYVGGGYVNINKADVQWGERATIGRDGKFYIRKSRLNIGAGDYRFIAIPSSASAYASGMSVLTMAEDGTVSPNPVSIALQAVQVSGTVYRAAGVKADGGNVDVNEVDGDNNRHWVTSAEIASDGTYKIGGLDESKRYFINANPPWEEDYFSSNVEEITFGETAVTINLTFAQPQITGNAYDSEGDNKQMLNGDQYDVNVRSADNKEFGYEWKARDGYFILGKLDPGAYRISIRPRPGSDYSAYTQSNEVDIAIDQNGTAQPGSIVLTLTQPMLTGIVKDKDGVSLPNNDVNSASGYVEVYKGTWTNMQYICSVPVDSSGYFKIGGLPVGDYYIRAGVDGESSLYSSNSCSKLMPIELKTGEIVSDVTLSLTDRSEPRIRWIDDAGVGSDRLNVRIYNFKKEALSGFAAELLDTDGSSFEPPLTISADKMNISWSDDSSGEANVEMFADGIKELAPGKYTLKLTYNSDNILSDSPAGNGFTVIYYMSVSPKGAIPSETPGMTLVLYADDGQGGKIPGIWNSDDTLTVKLITSIGEEYGSLIYGKDTDSISVTLPAMTLPDGWNNIEIYKGDLLLGRGGLLVGNPVINMVQDANEGDNCISVEGNYLAVYEKAEITGQVLDLNIDPNVLYTSDGVRFYDYGDNEGRGRLEFYFGDLQLPAGKYKFVIKDGDSAILDATDFNVAPQLLCTPHAVAEQSAAVITVKNSSPLDGFKWSGTDDISAFKVCIGNSGPWFDINSSNGLSFAEGDSGNLVISISNEDMQKLNFEEGRAQIDVYKNDKKVGFARLTLGNDIISGTVKYPGEAGTPAAGIKVNIMKQSQDDNRSILTITDSEGMFYIARQDMPWYYDGNPASLAGEYSFVIMAPQGLGYGSARMVNDDIVDDPDLTNNVTLIFPTAQINATVKAGTQSAGGGDAQVFKPGIDQQLEFLFNTDVNSDGTFSIGGLEVDAKYYIKAYVPNEIGYVPSHLVEVTVGATAQTIDVSLNPVQVSGAAKDADNKSLYDDQYNLRIRSLDPEIGENIGCEWRTEYGSYYLGGLDPGSYAISIQPNGGSLYSQSFETTFTVNSDGSVSENIIDLQFTNPILVGTVKYIDADQSLPLTEGYVDVLEGTWQNMKHVTTVGLDNTGTFRVGGIPAGKYFLRAAPGNGSMLYSVYSQSFMTPIDLTGATSEAPESVGLMITDKTPRIRLVQDAVIGDDSIRLRMVNVSSVTGENGAVVGLTAELTDQSGQPLTPAIVISNPGNFSIDEGSRDYDKDEADVLIKLDEKLNQTPGKYNLKLTYNNGTSSKTVANETPPASDPDSFNGFRIMYWLNADPYAVLAGTGSTGKTVKLFPDGESQCPWTDADSGKLTVKLISESGTEYALPNTINEDNALEVTISSASLPLTGLEQGKYSIAVYRGAVLLGMSKLYAGDPYIRGVYNISEDNGFVSIYGDNLIIYRDNSSVITGNVYQGESTEPFVTSTYADFDWGNLNISLGGKPIIPGDYRLELDIDGIEVTLPNNGAFRVFDLLYATPGYMLTANTSGKTVVLNAAEGRMPWNINDKLVIRIENDDRKDIAYELEVVTAASSSFVTFTMPDIAAPGRYSILVFNANDPENRKSVGYASFAIADKTQLTGTVKNSAGDPVPYASIQVYNDYDEWEFYADGNGNYAIYGVEPGDYTVLAAPPKGAILFNSESLSLTIGDDMNGNVESPYNFTLPAARLISGTISLPGMDTAPDGGIGIWICALDIGNPDDETDDFWEYKELYIEEGQHSIGYSLFVPDREASYIMQMRGVGAGIINTGMFYGGENGTVLTIAEASGVTAAADNSAIADFTLVKGNDISIAVSLPDGDVAPPEGINVIVSAVIDNGTENQDDDIAAKAVISIFGGQSSNSFTLNVPARSGYVISYESDKSNGFVEQGFCKDVDGTSYETVYERAAASQIDLSTSNKAVNMTLIPAKVISGTISLAGTGTAPGAGIHGWIVAWNDRGTQNNESDDLKFGTEFQIEPETNSAEYTINVPAMPGYRVTYFADQSDIYEKCGYYSANGTVFNNKDAALLDMSASGQTGINMTLSNVMQLSVIKAEAVEDGTAVRLTFNKQLDMTALPSAPAGFTVKVGGDPYEISGITADCNELILQLKDYKIFKDYKDITLLYDNITAVIKSYDGKSLESFTGKTVSNMSLRTVSIVTGFASGALLNRAARINVTTLGEAIIIKENGLPDVSGSTSVSKTIDTEGTHTIVISVAGRKNDASITFTIDKTAPIITISNCGDAVNNHDGVAPIIEFADDCVASSKVVTLNGQAYDGSTIKKAGTYVLRASASDAAGNVRTVSKEFSIVWDTGAPVINITGAENGQIYESATIGVSLARDTLSTVPAEYSNEAFYYYTVTLRLPDGTYTTIDKRTSPVVIAEGTAAGKYRLEILAVNPSYTDITSSRVIEYTIDKDTPTATISNVINNHTYNTAVTPLICFTDAIAPQQTLMDYAEIHLTRAGSPVENYHAGDTIAADGNYTLTAWTRDAFGHESVHAMADFIIDRTKPVVTISGALNGYSYKDQNVIVTIRKNEGTLTVLCNGAEMTPDGNGNLTFEGEADKAVVYKLNAKAVDSAGNTSEQELSFTIDRLAVNIVVNGVSDGMLINYYPIIKFTTFEGNAEKTGTTATIDGAVFAGGSYMTAGVHTMVLSYTSGSNIYTKSISFTIDKTVPQVSYESVLKNGIAATSVIYAKAGDSIKVRANITDSNGIKEANFSIGTVASAIPMKYVEGAGYFEGEFIVDSGNCAETAITVNASDKAGNVISSIHPAVKVVTDNTKPSVSAVTSPMAADGRNGIFKSPDMNITLTAGAADTILYNFNGTAANAKGSKQLTPTQGTNILVYRAQDMAGNVSDEKVYIFEYDSISPSGVTLTSQPSGSVNTQYVGISGSVANEGDKAGSKVLLKKAGEIVASANIKSDSTFVMDGIKLVEGQNSFTLTAMDLAGNESIAATVFTRTLDSTAPIIVVDKTDDTHYTIEVNEAVTLLSVKFNGIAITDPAKITEVAINGLVRKYEVETPDPIDGTNTLNASAADAVGNIGTGSFSSTHIPANTQQNDVQLNDNSTMDIPNTAFNSAVQMLVKTVDVNDNTSYKPLGAAVSFEFLNDSNDPVDPEEPLVIRNYIGAGLKGVALMHVDENGTVDSTVAATVTTSDLFDMNNAATINSMGSFDDPDPDKRVVMYISDTGYIVFKTKTFSGYAAVQDVTAPEIVLSTTDFNINKADELEHKMKIAGTLKVGGTGADSADVDTTAFISEVTIDSAAMSLSGLTAEQKGCNFDIPLALTDGTHEVAIKASDAAGNISMMTRTYYVDTTPTTLTATAATDKTNRDSIDISISTDEASEVFFNGNSVGCHNGSSVISFALTDGGANNINVTAIDAAGNTSSVSTIIVTRDSIAPSISITGVSNNGIYGSDRTIEVQVVDDHTTQAVIKMDGADFSNGLYTTEGQHTLTVDASDSFGNTSSRTVTFTIDKSVPIINITGAEDGGVYNTVKTLTISAENADELIVTRSVDGQAPQNVTLPETGGDMQLGADDESHYYLINVTARKNTTAAIATDNIIFTVDMKAPVIASTTATQTEAASINITGTISEMCDIYLGETKVITGSITGAFSITGQSLALGSNTFIVKAVDTAGNETSITITVERKTATTPGGDNPVTPPPFVPTVPIVPTVPAVPATDGSVITSKPVLKDGAAFSTITAEDINTAFSQATENAAGIKAINIQVEELPDAKAYTQELPASVMQTGSDKLNIAISTPYAAVTIPGDMFSSSEVSNKKTIAISVGKADIDTLDKDIAKAIGNRPVIDLSASIDGNTVAWNNPDAPVTVSIDYTPTSEELKNPEHIVVWYIDGKGNAIAVNSGRYDPAAGKVTFTTTHFSKYAISYVHRTFNDISNYGWAKKQIEVLASKGIINGTTADTFAPGSDITRADFIVLLVKALGLTAKVDSSFSDVKSNDYYYEAVGIAKKLGITGGTGNNMFKPNEFITRQDMMVLVNRALALQNKLSAAGNSSCLTQFTDVDMIAAYAKESVANLINEGIITGSNSMINPLGHATRAEIAIVVYRVYNKE